jgi:hypothetical protein
MANERGGYYFGHCSIQTGILAMTHVVNVTITKRCPRFIDALTLTTDAESCLSIKHYKKWDDSILNLFISHHPSNQTHP